MDTDIQCPKCNHNVTTMLKSKPIDSKYLLLSMVCKKCKHEFKGIREIRKNKNVKSRNIKRAERKPGSKSIKK